MFTDQSLRHETDLIVEVLNVDPLDALAFVLLLLLLQHELDEELLQALVAVVDAELETFNVVKAAQCNHWLMPSAG